MQERREIGLAEEVLMDDGTVKLNGFNRSSPDHPLHYDHAISLTDFYGQEIKMKLQPVDNDHS